MESIKNTALAMWLGIRAHWRQALAIHIIGTLIAYIVLVPLTSLLLNYVVSRSGNSALSDQEILFFVLTPFGLGCLILLAAIAITITAFKHAALIAALYEAVPTPGVIDALLFVAHRSARMLLLGGLMVVRLLVAIVPLLGAGWLLFHWLLSSHDINYYLTQKPPEFWLASGLIGLLALGTAVLILRMASGWVYSLPLVLFDRRSAPTALALSQQTAAGKKWWISGWIVAWAALDALLFSIALLLTTWLGSILLPWVVDSIRLLVVALGSVLLIGGLLTLVATFASAALFGALVLQLYLDAGLGHDQQAPAPARTPVRSQAQRPWLRRSWMAPGLMLAMVVAILSGNLLIEGLTVDDRTQIIAHRGASAAAPENTLAAIEQALNQGTDWVEIDVQESADGEIVVIHDRDLKKIGGVDLEVYSTNLQRLQAVDIGSWFAPQYGDQRIPTLTQVLLACRGRAKVLVELKYYGHEQQLERRVVEVIENTGMAQDIVVMSLHYAGIQRMRALRPSWQLGLLSSVSAGDLGGLDLDFYAINAGFVDRHLVRKAHSKGRKVLVWTVNDAIAMSLMMSRGVDGIITDEPGLARSVKAQRAELGSGERLLLELATWFGYKTPLAQQ